jgi:hypothetical protein
LHRVVLGDSERFEFLRKEQITKPCGVGKEAVADFGRILGAADLIDPVASVIATMCIASGVAVHVASAFAITTTTSSSSSIVGGTAAAATSATTTTAPQI